MTRTVAVNCRPLSKPTHTGVANYTRRLLSALASRAAEDDFTYLAIGVERLPAGLREAEFVNSAGEQAWAHGGPLAHCWEQVGLPVAVRRHDPDLLFTPAGQAPPLVGTPQVTTIHDLSPIVHPEWFSREYATLYRLLTPMSVRAADEIIAVSRFTAEAVRDRYHPTATVHTVHNGVMEPPEAPHPSFEVPERYFLFVGAVNPRKNLTRLLRAYRRHRERSDDPAGLVLVGPDRDVFGAVEVPAVDGVVTPGYVSDAELGWLYRNAVGLAYPSLYEGFGLPILEAMSVGTPVLTSDRGATREVAGDAAVLVDPEDTDALADGLARLVGNPDRRDQLSDAGRERAGRFDWDRTAAGTEQVFRRLLAD